MGRHGPRVEGRRRRRSAQGPTAPVSLDAIRLSASASHWSELHAGLARSRIRAVLVPSDAPTAGWRATLFDFRLLSRVCAGVRASPLRRFCVSERRALCAFCVQAPRHPSLRVLHSAVVAVFAPSPLFLSSPPPILRRQPPYDSPTGIH
jgi:hypothetical protein